MRQKKVFQFMWLISILVTISLSCSALSGFVEEKVEEVADNIIDTQVDSLITEIEPMITDIESIITEVDVDEIIESISTEFPEPENTGERPAGIPIIEPNSDFVTSKTHVEYSVQKTVKEVSDFYEKEMPANGWTKVEAESKVESGVTTLVYTQGNRKATIEVEEDIFFGGTFVIINIVES